MTNKQYPKKVDCALIFMLDEERDYFLKFNKQFILLDQNDDNFKEFIFFDKAGMLRKGVMCSNGIAMGNTEACALFYKLSRKYIADLYINLGVSGLIKDVNIGDVIIVNRLSTLGEENATDSAWQLKDTTFPIADDAEIALSALTKKFSCFSNDTKEEVLDFKNQLKEKTSQELIDFDYNEIKLGWCGTVPEVIKGKNGREKFPALRKLNIVDMEAYYLVQWHYLVKKTESKNSNKNSKILVFKSSSDYGDENKKIFEECGSRKLAMNNLCKVVSYYCTEIHDYPRNSNETIYSYFDSNVRKHSIDDFVETKHPNFSKALNQFEELCSYFIEVDDESYKKEQCIQYAAESLSSFDSVLLLCGRSGTSKSTYMSYLYYLCKEQQGKNAILIDFSKYSVDSNPSSMQITYLLGKLLNTEKDLYIFLDGIDVNAPYYESLLSVLEKDNYTNISYCIGDAMGSSEPINMVPKRLNITKIEFSGISLYFEQFDEVLNKAEKYFKIIGHDFNATDVKDFVVKSEITNIDFRLLSMMSDHCQSIAKCKSLYTFLNSYLIAKFGRTELEKYKKSPFIFCADKIDKLPIEFKKIYHNTYANSLCVAQEIIDIFEKKDKDRINLFTSSKFILSDDMNLFLQHQFKNNKHRIDIVDNIIETLSSKDNISVCVETQLMYSISSIVKENTSQYEKFLNLLKNKLQIAKENCNNKLESQHLWAIQYRTLCIILYKYFRIIEPLCEYNEKLTKDSITMQLNLNFHFLYYSKSPFTFDNINRFDIRFLSNELFFNTYYMLKQFLEKNISNNGIENNMFVFMNIITYLQLIDEIVIKEKRFLHLTSEFRETIKSLDVFINSIAESSTQKPKHLDYISKMLNHLIKKLC